MPTAKHRVVLDTNVLVSAGIRVESTPYQIVDAVLSGKLDAFHCDATESEATQVISRARFKRYGFPPAWMHAFFRLSHRVPTPATDLIEQMPDPADMVFLLLARQQHAVLVTGNISDYPAHLRDGVDVVTAAEFIERFVEVVVAEEEHTIVGVPLIALEVDAKISELHPGRLDAVARSDDDSRCVPPYCSKDGRRRCRRHGGG